MSSHLFYTQHHLWGWSCLCFMEETEAHRGKMAPQFTLPTNSGVVPGILLLGLWGWCSLSRFCNGLTSQLPSIGCFLSLFQGGFTMCSETGSRCSGMLLLALAIMAIIANLLLYFPNGQVLELAKITDLVWFFHGFFGAGLLVRMHLATLLPPSHKAIISSWVHLPWVPSAWLTVSFSTSQYMIHKHLTLGTASIYLCAPPLGYDFLKNTTQVSFIFAL